MDDSEKENNLKKLGEISHYASIAVWTVLALSLISMAVSLTMIVLIGINYPPMMDMLMHMRTTKENALYNYSSTVVISMVSLIMMLFMDRLFTNIRRSYTPFTFENAKVLKYAALVLLLSAILMPLIFVILASLLNQRYQISIEILLFVLSLIVYCISLVFRYGAVLQKESDETL
jgi:hypothetical protein